MYRLSTELLQIVPLLLLLTLVGLIRLWWRRRDTRGRLLLITVPFSALLVASLPAVAFLALGSLEWQYPLQLKRPPEAEAIVVLGGYVVPPTETQPRAVLGWDSYVRCLHAADLYSQGVPRPLVVTGGKVDPTEPGPTIAQVMAAFLVSRGIPAKDIWVEDRSRSTYQNAAETRRLLDAKGITKIIIVTDATHLLRAEMCFRAQGFSVTTSGCNYSTDLFEWSVLAFLPNWGAVGDCQRALHEWLGIAYYRLLGRV